MKYKIGDKVKIVNYPFDDGFLSDLIGQTGTIEEVREPPEAFSNHTELVIRTPVIEGIKNSGIPWVFDLQAVRKPKALIYKRNRE